MFALRFCQYTRSVLDEVDLTHFDFYSREYLERKELTSNFLQLEMFKYEL